MIFSSLLVFGKPAAGVATSQPPTNAPLSTASLSTASLPAQEKTGPDPAELAKAEKAAVAAARKAAKEAVQKFRKAWDEAHKDIHSFTINKQKAAEVIDEAVASLTHAENCETADEIERMVMELDEELCDMLRLLAEKKELVEEKTATYKETRDVELAYKRPLDLLERTHSDSVLQKFEDFTIRLHEAKKLIAETKKLSVVSKPRRASEFDPKFEVRLQESMKNMARYFTIVRAHVEDIERKMSHLALQKKKSSNTTANDQSLSNSTLVDQSLYEEAPSSVIYTPAFKPITIPKAGSKLQQRARMLEIMNAKKNMRIVTKKVEPLRIDAATADDTLSSSFLNVPNLETSLSQKISSPFRVKPPLAMRNASTQADAPAPPATTAPALPQSASGADFSIVFFLSKFCIFYTVLTPNLANSFI
ncbi:unnamed protein product [Cylicostephanus goldi]|uniref:Uncharacterized protein n=1 Tax=Cylicostephanus goldi TaxID=71465 RepID=A0A3P6SD08_CYLGO|nr:unnamed protein product [Cylicostephanus goldi]